jgi:hypothetical protein
MKAAAVERPTPARQWKSSGALFRQLSVKAKSSVTCAAFGTRSSSFSRMASWNGATGAGLLVLLSLVALGARGAV